jgi:hypothetical protein
MSKLTIASTATMTVRCMGRLMCRWDTQIQASAIRVTLPGDDDFIAIQTPCR